MTHAIEIKGLTKRFGRTRAVDGMTLAIPEGSIFALLGPNGAGKTTTLRTVMNIHRPSAGSARVLGVDSRRLGPAELQRIGYVSENQALPEWMRVRELLAFCQGLYPTWDAAFVERLLRQLDLDPDVRLRAASRGMRMKAALLAAIGYRPRLLVLDEPFSGLDPLVRDDLVRGVLEMAGQEGWTVLVSSHDIDEVERLADWVGMLSAGRLELAEPAASLQERFRRIDVTLADDAPVRDPPPTWLDVAQEGRRLAFVDSAYRAGESDAALRSRFGDAAQIEVMPLALREIFVTLAKTYRLAGHEVAA
jgi:ABC-2 type transport system ATP-binding protein